MILISFFDISEVLHHQDIEKGQISINRCTKRSSAILVMWKGIKDRNYGHLKIIIYHDALQRK